MEIQEPWFSLLLRGTKTVEGRKCSPKWCHLAPGQDILVTCGEAKQMFRIIDIRKYKTLEEYLLSEGLEKCLPGIRTLEEGVAIYKQWSTNEEIEKYGFMGIEMVPI